MRKNKQEWGGFSAGGLALSTMGFIAFPLVFSSLGIVFSAIALGKNQKGSIAGLVLGGLGWIFGVVYFLATLSKLGFSII